MTVTKYQMYNNSIDLYFDSSKHTYYTLDSDNNKNIVDGVTSVLKVINKPALIQWSANQAVEYINENLKVGTPIDEVQKAEMLKAAKTAHRTFRDKAGDLGSILHSLVEAYAKGLSYQEPMNPILQESFSNFKQWVKDNDVEFKSSERVVFSKKHNYAGTLDATGTVKGVKCLIDLKTSSGIWDEYFLQCAAYKEALQEEFPDIKIDHTIIIRCGKDGSFEVKEANDHEENIEAFLAALTLHRRLKRMGFERRK